MRRSVLGAASLVAVALSAGLVLPLSAQEPAQEPAPERALRWDPGYETPRNAWGQPDLQGSWTNATLTRFERQSGDGPTYSWDEAIRIEEAERMRVEAGFDPSDPDRPPPEPGSVGSYNQVYYDRGDRLATVDGRPRTSLITIPSDGRIPPLSPEGLRRQEAHRRLRAGFGEYDHPELRPLAERCVVYYASSPTGVLGPPMTPTAGYNNNVTIVQNADHVVILAEMIHDVRIVRLDGAGPGDRDPLPGEHRPWFGDSRGRWDGNTLVVETTNIHPDQGIREGDRKILHSEEIRVVERFTRVDDDTILYQFEVHDPMTYTEVWGGEIPFERFDRRLYEYACHEGNYSLGNVLSGARYQERMEAGEEGEDEDEPD